MWGDAKTGDPIRIEATSSGVPRTEVVMSEFEMNVDVEAGQFSLEVPKDYKVQSFDIDASAPREEDLVKSLRFCAEMSGGDFPDSLDTQSVTKVIIASVLKSRKSRPAER